MSRDRNVQPFHDRAPGYDDGWLGKLHHDIAERTAALALARAPWARHVLDVGCGTGYLLRQLGAHLPEAVELVGIDAAPGMIAVAEARAGGDRRLRFAVGVAERLPLRDEVFDLVVSTTSFDHWADQQAGLHECARVLTPGGQLVLTDLFSWWLLPTLLVGHRGRARTVRRARRLLTASGFHSLAWQNLYTLLLRTVTATR